MGKSKYNIGDVYLVNFPFDEINKSKIRPAIIIDPSHIAILCIYVTSKDKENPFSIEITDWQQAGLASESWARIDRVVPIDEYNIIKRLGTLSNNDFQKITALYQEKANGKYHEFSLLAFKNTNGEFLQIYDPRWKCWLFPYFRTEEDNKAAADKFASDLIGDKVFTQYVTSSIHCKFSVSDQVYKVYDHKLYKLTLDPAPEHMQKKEFQIDDTKYRWMSFSEMENDDEIMEKNEEIVAFIKKNCN